MTELPSINLKEKTKSARKESYEAIQKSRKLRSNIKMLLKLSPSLDYSRSPNNFLSETQHCIRNSPKVSLDLHTIPNLSPTKFKHSIFNAQAIRNLTQRSKKPDGGLMIPKRNFENKKTLPLLVESIDMSCSRKFVFSAASSPTVSSTSYMLNRRSKLQLSINIPFPKVQCPSPD